MKIIDNKKDYYDYVVGEYGIDDLIVFDRRQSTIAHTDRLVGNMNDYIFNNSKQEKGGKGYHRYRFVLKAGAILYGIAN